MSQSSPPPTEVESDPVEVQTQECEDASVPCPSHLPPTPPPKPERSDILAPSLDRGAGWLRIVGSYRRGVLQIVVEEFRRLGFKVAPSEVPDSQISLFWSRSFFPRLAALQPTQKVNWLPGMNEICRKDFLGKHLTAFARRFGAEHAPFWPESFNLPSEWALFEQAFRANPMPFILKPPLAARGEGIRLYAKEGDAMQDDAFLKEKHPLAQRYIANPLLFDGTYKMSFRFYVALTSVDPLRIYVYRDGLVRICSTPYVFGDFDNLLVHLTNYDLQIVNEENFVQTMKEKKTECTLDGLRADWKELKRNLESKGHDVEAMWVAIQDLVTKSFIAAEGPITKAIKTHVRTRGSAYEVTGFDVLLDENLKPWLLEVNHTPSLCPHTNLENDIKRNMLRELYQLVDVERKRITPTRAKHDLLVKFWNQEKEADTYESTHNDTIQLGTEIDTSSVTTDVVRDEIQGEDASNHSPSISSPSTPEPDNANDSNISASDSAIQSTTLEGESDSSKRSSINSAASSTTAYSKPPNAIPFPVNDKGEILPDKFVSSDIWCIVDSMEEVRPSCCEARRSRSNCYGLTCPERSFGRKHPPNAHEPAYF